MTTSTFPKHPSIQTSQTVALNQNMYKEQLKQIKMIYTWRLQNQPTEAVNFLSLFGIFLFSTPLLDIRNTREGVHVGTVNLMISSGTVILILCAVFFYFYCKGRRGFCCPPATSPSPPAAPAMGFQQPMVIGVSDTHVLLLNEYIVELNPAKFNILNQILNWICLQIFELNIFLN